MFALLVSRMSSFLFATTDRCFRLRLFWTTRGEMVIFSTIVALFSKSWARLSIAMR
jgi:hypothetical protein